MQQLELGQAASYLESATIQQSYDTGHAIIHIGKSASGTRFVMVNDAFGQTAVTESL